MTTPSGLPAGPLDELEAGQPLPIAKGGTGQITNSADLSLSLAPAGVNAETFPRGWSPPTTYLSGLTSGTVYASAIALPIGLTVSAITLDVGNAAFTSVTHGWYALLDKNLVVRAVSADQTSGNWGTTFTLVPLAMASPYTTPSTSLYYIGFCAVFSVSGSFPALSAALGGITGVAPVLQGTSSTGQTTPPSTGATLASVTSVAADRFYAYTS